ncbi:alkylmercury lyase [[Mycobacterium] crassicus]|uniref:Alkylmercury lyase n=1 Tax=[Mycobacterium] crassicus TaxID=2872309 RepID=A0ABU5XP17_9MYCO|nr:alkylmercury lyase [Mycolicibacter sp. MYC098]MEB3024020.1 alkylmercury lyase [Mycolicibacter sp. MYC098]
MTDRGTGPKKRLVQLLSVPDCPHVEQARATLRQALADLAIAADVEELIGDYPSPTVVIDGRDVVTGAPPAPGACCRLDLPTAAQIAEALRHGG